MAIRLHCVHWTLLILLTACAQESESAVGVDLPSAWPEGTVLAVNQVPILGAEVDALCPAVAAIYPAYSMASKRRLVLTNLFLNQAAVQSRDRSHWRKARAECEAQMQRIRSGDEPQTPITTYSGGPNQMGFDVWSHASTQPPGRWFGPLDLIGQWAILRLDVRDEVTRNLEVSILEFAYIDPKREFAASRQESILAARDASQLLIIDPEWAEYVPMEWQFKMRAKQ